MGLDAWVRSKFSRYLSAGCIAALITVVSALVANLSGKSSLGGAITILIVSLLGFHLVGVLTPDCPRLWRCVDYPWILTTFMTIVLALTNIQETARLAPLKLAVSDRRAAYDSLIYSMKSVITNDCHPKASRAGMWQPSPEPYPGECDRIEHILPQIERAAAEESDPSKLNSGAYWGQGIIEPNTQPVGSWDGLYNDARKFTESAHRTQKAIEESARIPASPIASWATGNSLRYWYFVLAFFLGLRVSKVSVELMATWPDFVPLAIVMQRFAGVSRRVRELMSRRKVSKATP